jgi:chemotaxis signal transduction protein
MQLLTFQIGRYLLALPAAQVLSVGREGQAPGGAAAGDTVDLAAILGVETADAEQRPVIRSNQSGRIVELKVDRILALESCEGEAVRGWPGLLRPVNIYTGVALISGRLFPVIDISRIKDWRKGRRR